MATTRRRSTAAAPTVELPHSEKTLAAAAQVEKLEKKGMKRADIAEQLSIMPNRTWYLSVVAQTLRGEIEPIAIKDEASAKKLLPKLRKDGMSWGEISARSGFSEGKLKVIGEELGLSRQLTGKGGRPTNGSAPAPAPAPATPARRTRAAAKDEPKAEPKATTRRKATTSAKAATAKATARRTRKAPVADPSNAG